MRKWKKKAVPITVGVTKKEGKGGCAWVLKKEHLYLSEVGPMLKVINEEKRDMDRSKGKRVHDFFLPPGSKILVASYVHLRREGLDGYIADFNNMVREMWGMTGDSGVEVLPVCPVIWEGLDERGRELIHGLQDWIKWVSDVTYKPDFLKLQVKQGGGNGEWRERGNCLSFMREERREVRLRMVGPARELGKLVEAKLEESGAVVDREKDKRETFYKGVSVEAKVIVGGPGNSLFRHGSGDKRGFCPERTARVERNVQGEVTRVSVEYHMTEPERVTLIE